MTASEPCYELRVLVVRMRADHQNAVVDTSGCSRLRQCDDAALLGSDKARHRDNRGCGYYSSADCSARDASARDAYVRDAYPSEVGQEQSGLPRYRVAARARPPCVGCGNANTSLTIRSCSTLCASA